jgi:hypothetical protein
MSEILRQAHQNTKFYCTAAFTKPFFMGPGRYTWRECRAKKIGDKIGAERPQNKYIKVSPMIQTPLSTLESLCVPFRLDFDRCFFALEALKRFWITPSSSHEKIFTENYSETNFEVTLVVFGPWSSTLVNIHWVSLRISPYLRLT